MRKLKIFQHIPTRWHAPLPTVSLPAVDCIQLCFFKGEEEKNVTMPICVAIIALERGRVSLFTSSRGAT